MRVIATIAGILACLSAFAAPVYDGNSVVLNDFESPADLANWEVRDLTSFALTSAWAAHGKSAAAITYQQWGAGKEQWPAVIALASRGSLPVTDLSQYDALEFALYNPQDRPVDIAVHARDAAQARFAVPFSIAAQSRREVSIAVDEIAAQSLEVSKLAELHFYVSRPAQGYAVYLDNLRLSVNLAPRAQVVLEAADSLTRQVGGATRQPSVLPADLQASVEALPDLAARARRLYQRVNSRPLTDLGEVLRTRRQLVRLSAELDALKPLGPRLQALDFARRQGADRFVLAVESPMRKVFLESDRFVSAFAPRYDLAAARNEHESLQVVVYPLQSELRKVQWQLSPLSNAAGETISGTVRVVGYVDCKQPSYSTPGQGWYPDPLLDFLTQLEKLPANEVQPLWVTVNVPANARPGDYTGKLTVTAQDARPQSVDLRLRVWDFALPERGSLRTALQLSTALGGLYPKDRLPEMIRKYEDWMLTEYHLNPGSIYAQVPTWDAERLRDLVSKGLSGINLSYVNAPNGESFDAESHWHRLDQQMDEIEKYLKVVDEAGARDLCYSYCFDERPGDELGVLFATAAKLRGRFPDIEVMTTAYDTTFGLGRPDGDKVNIWVPLTPKFDQNAVRLAEAREAGRDVWWYICIGPQHPYANWFIEYPAIEARLIMGAMAARYRPGGFLYYAVNRWPVNDKPITFGPRTDWNPASYLVNNGDGSLLCASPEGPLATLRLENVRDGMEDYEYYLLLRKLLTEKRGAPAVGEVPQAVVKDLTHFTSEPQVVLAERGRVAQEILRLLAK